MPLLEVKNLSVTIGAARIIKAISFAVDSGEGVSLVGPNGAGKTTVLRAILQLLTGVSGEVVLCGRNARELSPRELAREIGYVPQRVPLAFPYTVEAFVRMSRYPYEPSLWRTSAEDERATEEALELTDTGRLRKRALPELSGGELQRVLLAGAVAQKPKLLLLDEPAASLDPKYGKALHDLLATLRKTLSLGVLSVSHDLNAAVRHSNRILALRAGEIFFNGSPGDFVKPGVLEELYEIPFDRITMSGESALGVLPRV